MDGVSAVNYRVNFNKTASKLALDNVTLTAFILMSGSVSKGIHSIIIDFQRRYHYIVNKRLILKAYMLRRFLLIRHTAAILYERGILP